MPISSVAFCFPFHLVSGVPVLFANIANYFSRNYPYKTYVVDYADGYMSQVLQDNDMVDLIVFETGKPVLIDTDVLIIQSILPYAMRPEINIAQDTKLLFWNLHPDNLIPKVFPWSLTEKSYPWLYRKLVKIFWQSKYKLMRAFITDAIHQNSLVFMDAHNLDATGDFFDIDTRNRHSYLPIACSEGGYRKPQEAKVFNEINISWVGRICNFKIHSINYLILRLSQASKELDININLHLIGDGPEVSSMENTIHLHDGFNIITAGSLPKTELDKYLLSNIDINASMGTSVLESAKYGIPSIVLDYSYQPINERYKFRWLHKSKHFDVGHMIGEADFRNDHMEMGEMIHDYITNYKTLSEKSYEYYLTNHALQSVSEQLQKQVAKLNLTFSQIKPRLLQKGLLRKMYERRKYGI
jgi:hypothetical protein